MDTIPVEQWLLRVSGSNVFRKVWQPLLRAKFDTLPIDNIPATYIWSRLRRMLSTRQGVTSREMMCYLEGGYYSLIEAMSDQCQKRGVVFSLNTMVQEIVIKDGRSTGVQTFNGFLNYDLVISTLPSPVLVGIIPGAPDHFRDQLASQEYLGVICPLLILDRALTPYYVLNITDESIPFTAVVETTNLIDPGHVGNHHLVYLPKYIKNSSEIATWSDEKVEAEWLKHLKRMFPDFQEGWIGAVLVQRAAFVEPLRATGTTDHIPTIRTPMNNFFMANTAMVYPDLNNGESVTRLAQRVTDAIKDAIKET
jgi:protoporphyrinogen oxidase